MSPKFLLFAIVVTMATTGTSWVKMLATSRAIGSGSSWSSHGGGGYYGGGSGYSGGGGGGGHK